MAIKIDQLVIELVRKFVRKLEEATSRTIETEIEKPLTTDELQELFTEIRWNFGLVPLKLVLMHDAEFVKLVGTPTAAAVGQGQISMNVDYLDALRRKGGEGACLLAILGLLVHENGHPYIPYRSPGTFRNKLDDAKRVEKMLGDKQAIAIKDLLNIVYDTFIDVFSFDRVLYDPREVLNCLEAMREERTAEQAKLAEKINAKLGKALPGKVIVIGSNTRRRDHVGQYLISFRQVMMGDLDFGICEIDKPVSDTARKVVKLIRETEGETEKIEKGIVTIARWLTELFTSEPEEQQEGDGSDDGESSGKPGKPGKGKPKKGKAGNLTEEELKKLQKAIKEAMEELGLNGESATAEDLEEKPLEKKLEQVDIGDGGDREMAAKVLELNDEDAAFYFLWTLAAQKVKLQPPLGKAGEGTVYSAGNVPWMLGMPLKDLDVRATIESGGRFIPGVTTVQPHFVPGPGMPQEGTSPRVMGSFDVSGSMWQSSPVRDTYNLDTVLIAAFAIIHEAKRRKVPVAFNLFGDHQYYVDWSTNYEEVARKLFKNCMAPGGGNSCAGLEKDVRANLAPGDLLIYATDFYLCGSEEKAAKILQELLRDGVHITFIAMFNHCAEKAGIPFVECQTLEDLEGISLKSISANM